MDRREPIEGGTVDYRLPQQVAQDGRWHRRKPDHILQTVRKSHATSLLVCGTPLPFTAFAQPSSWQAKAKVQAGPCPDGVVVFVTEQPGKARLNMTSDGKPGAQVDVTLAQDGSGSTEFQSYLGKTRRDIAAGTGKRSMQLLDTAPSQYGWKCYIAPLLNKLLGV